MSEAGAAEPHIAETPASHPQTAPASPTSGDTGGSGSPGETGKTGSQGGSEGGSGQTKSRQKTSKTVKKTRRTITGGRKSKTKTYSFSGHGMTPEGSRQVILMSMFLSGALITADSFIQNGSPPPLRTGIGIAFAGIAMSALADPIPQIIGPLAVLWMLTVLFLYAPRLFGKVNITQKAQPPTPKEPLQ